MVTTLISRGLLLLLLLSVLVVLVATASVFASKPLVLSSLVTSLVSLVVVLGGILGVSSPQINLTVVYGSNSNLVNQMLGN